MSPFSHPHTMIMAMALACGLYFAAVSAIAETLDPFNFPDDWKVLIDDLRTNRPLRADFAETRTLPFRRDPVLLSGTLRLDDEGALSLHYPEAEDSLVIVIDRDGMAMRSNADPWRSLPNRRSVRAVHNAIAALLSLEFERLGDDFNLNGVWADEAWSMQLMAKPGANTGRLKELSVQGTRYWVTRIQVELGGEKGILIEIFNQEVVSRFGPDEYEQYFR